MANPLEVTRSSHMTPGTPSAGACEADILSFVAALIGFSRISPVDAPPGATQAWVSSPQAVMTDTGSIQ